MKLDYFLISYTKIKSKWIKDLNVSPETIKILEESTASHLFDTSNSNFFLDRSPEARETKAKISYWDYIKMKSFRTARKPSTKLKDNLLNGRRYLQMTYLIRVGIQNLVKNLSKSTPKKPNNPVKKWAKDMIRHFSKEDIHMANRHMRRYSTPLIIREMQIKTTVRCHSHLSEWLKLTTQEATDVGKDVEKGEPSYTVGGNANCCRHSGKQYGVSSKS